ncbi:MAG: hypothetical protein R8G66_24495 [Cytophagales bacterium]|nr:hypothetical protein [Cytophagales bacterium]
MPSISSQGILSEAQEQRIQQVVKYWFWATLTLFFCFLTITYLGRPDSLKYVAVGLAFLLQFVGLSLVLIIKQRRTFQRCRKVQTVFAVLIGLSALMMGSMMILLMQTS